MWCGQHEKPSITVCIPVIIIAMIAGTENFIVNMDRVNGMDKEWNV
ncbi:hypothetical protein [Romboutsia weinsteinii]|nr:hypothetical protein [Romboutsia weinsteinii]